MGKDSRKNFFTNSYNIEGMDITNWEQLLSQFHMRTIIPPLDASHYGRKFRTLTYIKTLPEVDNVPLATAIVSIKEDIVKLMIIIFRLILPCHIFPTNMA